jgi:hypothetical protein
MKLLDWDATEARAKTLPNDALLYSIADCLAASRAAAQLEKAGTLGYEAKSEGYYHDEISVYRRELKRRQVKFEASRHT